MQRGSRGVLGGCPAGRPSGSGRDCKQVGLDEIPGCHEGCQPSTTTRSAEFGVRHMGKCQQSSTVSCCTTQRFLQVVDEAPLSTLATLVNDGGPVGH